MIDPPDAMTKPPDATIEPPDAVGLASDTINRPADVTHTRKGDPPPWRTSPTGTPAVPECLFVAMTRNPSDVRHGGRAPDREPTKRTRAGAIRGRRQPERAGCEVGESVAPRR